MNGATVLARAPEAAPDAPAPPVPWFRSDNVSGVCPEILAALAAANAGQAPAYGGDALTAELDARFSALFEHPVAVLPVATGTAANALALAVVPAHTNIFCHADAHILLDEAGAVEFLGGVRLTGIAGAEGKLSPAVIEQALSGRRSSGSLASSAVSIAQATELGTLYSLEETAAVAAVAHCHGMMLHMDGARFANAVAALGCSPAEASWRAGIDILSFGATKNGALAAEAVVLFDPAHAGPVAAARKRTGHTLSKMRFLSAQFAAYLDDGLWLRNADRANKRAKELEQRLRRVEGVRLVAPVATNQLFAEFTDEQFTALAAAGIEVMRWGGAGSRTVRLVTAFDTGAEEIDRFAHALAGCPEAGKVQT